MGDSVALTPQAHLIQRNWRAMKLWKNVLDLLKIRQKWKKMADLKKPPARWDVASNDSSAREELRSANCDATDAIAPWVPAALIACMFLTRPDKSHDFSAEKAYNMLRNRISRWISHINPPEGGSALPWTELQ